MNSTQLPHKTHRIHNVHKPGLTGLAVALALLAAPATGRAADIWLVAQAYNLTLPDGAVVPMWGFAAAESGFANPGLPTVPGPLLSVAWNDPALTIHLRNDLTVGVSIVIPGQVAALTPVRAPDGRATSFTTETAPGQDGVYNWTLRPGSYLYFSGTHPAVQVQMGLYGGVTKDAAAGQAYMGTPAIDASYDNEAIVLYSEIDPALHQAVASGNYGPAMAMTSTLDYRPKYFLINGQPSPTGALILAHPLFTGQRLLIRFFNAGLINHVPTLLGLYMNIISEDGNLYPYKKEQYSILLPAGKTADALLTPTVAGDFAVYDRRLYLSNADVSPGGLLTHLSIATPIAVPPVSKLLDPIKQVGRGAQRAAVPSTPRHPDPKVPTAAAAQPPTRR